MVHDSLSVSKSLSTTTSWGGDWEGVLGWGDKSASGETENVRRSLWRSGLGSAGPFAPSLLFSLLHRSLGHFALQLPSFYRQ